MLPINFFVDKNIFLAERGFDPRTSGLGPSTLPLRHFASFLASGEDLVL